jgi:hypothetical protein
MPPPLRAATAAAAAAASDGAKEVSCRTTDKIRQICDSPGGKEQIEKWREEEGEERGKL